MPRRYSAKSKKSSFRRRRPSSKSKRSAYRKKRNTRPRRGTKFGYGQRTKNFLSRRAYAKHCYCETISLTSGSETNVAVYEFSANSLYDPNKTGTGHQPMGRDEVAGMYQNYHVSGGTIEVTYYSHTSASIQDLACPMVGIHIPTLDADGTQTDPIADDDNFSELVEAGVIQPSGKKNHMQHAYAGKPLTLKRRWSNMAIAKDAVQSRSLINNPAMGAGSGGNPATNLSIQLWATSPTGGDHADVTAVVKITYECTWTDPVLVGQS